MASEITITDVTGGDIVRHVFNISAKAHAFDALVAELTRRSDEYAATAREALADAKRFEAANNPRDTLLAEHAWGRYSALLAASAAMHGMATCAADDVADDLLVGGESK
jgi:hypothetical protein